jgi:hypothetical protein
VRGLVGVAACSSAQAAHQGTGGAGFAEDTAPSGEAIAQSPECNQTDSTVTCCLKGHPGEYERCGAPPPTQKPNRLPPRGKVPTVEEKARRKKVCQGYYEECISKGGEGLERYTHGHTHCQECYTDCLTTGTWPDVVNDHLCPEVSK